MRRSLVLLILVLAWPHTGRAQPSPPAAVFDATVQRWLDASLDGWVALYRKLHAKPELSNQERETAALVASELQRFGYEVTSGVGGFGVVGVLRNGPGSTLLLRGDMDALPVQEQTGLPYASRVQADNGGERVSVMHACGHDVHVSNLLASAAFLGQHRALWSGTLLIVAQPAEEVGEGAARMIEGGLFKRFARPDFALALHVEPELRAGQVGATSGWAAANVDSLDLTFFGRGGHGAQPQAAVDPVVMAAHFVTAVQTLISRRNDPQQPAVITIGSIHGGTRYNIIPDSVALQLTVRSYADDVRERLLDGIGQLARDLATSFGAPRPPQLTIKERYTPAVYNDPALTASSLRVLATALGEKALANTRPTMGGEDFGLYGKTLKVPSVLLRLGATPEAVQRASQRPNGPSVPALHSSRFAPDAPLALRTGVRSVVAVALSLLSKR